MDWSRQRDLPFTFFPYRVTCAACEKEMACLVPRRHWQQRVEIHQPPQADHSSYAVFYPEYRIRNKGDGETFIYDAPGYGIPQEDRPTNPESHYLEFQNLHDILNLLAQSADNPWGRPPGKLRPRAFDNLEEAMARLNRTIAKESDPEQRQRLRTAADNLAVVNNQLQQQREYFDPFQEGQWQTKLNSQLAKCFSQAWSQLETARRSKAQSLRDIMTPLAATLSGDNKEAS